MVLRFNALIIGFTPSAGYVYFPSVIETLITVGLVATEVAVYVLLVKRFPILSGIRTRPVPTGKPAPKVAAAPAAAR